MTETQWKTLFGAIAAVCSFLLVQTDVVVPPVAKVILGCVLVALAVVNPSAQATK